VNKNTLLANKKNIAWTGCIALFLLLPLLFSGFNYGISILCFIALYIVATSGLDILYGYCGQISLGHVAYFAFGAYGSAMLHQYFGIPNFLCMILASLLGALIGAIIAYPASKLVFHFLSLATMAFGEVMHQFVAHSPKRITGDSTGFFADRLSFFGYKLDSYTKYYYFSLICVLLFLFFKTRLAHSRIGRAFEAIRENSVAAAGMGVNVTKYKVIAFATSAFYTAFAGAMYMYLIRYISPDTIVYKQSVMFLTMLLFGGTASLWGPICGSVAIVLINEGIRFAERYQMLIYGILLLLVILVLPGGLYGEGVSLVARIKQRIGKAKENANH
jgi:branched-chain amino acid transport system permease protein